MSFILLSDQQLDTIVRKKSCFESFQALLDAKGNYRPTISIVDKDDWNLVQAYNHFQATRKDKRRAYTAGSEPRVGDPIQFYANNGERYGRIEKVGKSRLLASYVTKTEIRLTKRANARAIARGEKGDFTPNRQARYFQLRELVPVSRTTSFRYWRIQ